MSEYFPNWLKTKLRWLRPRHGAPPPTFMRVAYCVPRQIVLITTRYEDADNIWPMDWHVPLSLDPELYGIAVNRTSYGAELVQSSKVFVVNFVPATWEDVIFVCGSNSGRAVDKFAATGLAQEEAETVDAPRLADALGCLECRVEQTIGVGDHTFFVGRVSHSIYRADAPRLHHLDSALPVMTGTAK
jgi:flavin reductase (DIM6/NTAB) family NADH-FMN oxidoreductase RutF